MTKLQRVFGFLGALVLSAVILSPRTSAAPPPVRSALPEPQQAALTAAIAEKKSYAAIVSEAVAAGMDCEEVVWFLCKKCDNAPSQVYEIVYAAITGGCAVEKVVSGSLRAGARLQTVVQAGKAAGAGREAISAAAIGSGYSATEISNAFAGTSGGGGIGAGYAFDGPIGNGSVGGGPIGGGLIGGGAGGVYASPYKP